MLGDDLKVVDGAAAGAWIEPGLGGEFGAVSLQVRQFFEAYARVFHRPHDTEGNPVTWAEVARRLGSAAHAAMQWHQLVGSSDSYAQNGSRWEGRNPELGEMEIEELDHLCRALVEHTVDPEHCFFGIGWISHSHFLKRLPRRDREQPLLHLPHGREHTILEGPLAAIDQIYWDEDESFWSGRREAPSLIWPADRSWYVTTEVDFDTTLVGGSRELVDGLVATPHLEVAEVEPDTSLAAFSDQLNPVPEADEG
jgi:hypothetical protein